jgi:hypothetical protein
MIARPTDIHGNPIEMGPWYWAKSRTGKIVGTGKFAVAIGGGEVTWFINGTGYDPANFTFVKSELPDFSFGITCEHDIPADQLHPGCLKPSPESERDP